MRIESSQLQLHASHQALTRYTREETLDISMPNRQGQMNELHLRHRHVSERSNLDTYESLQKQSGPHLLEKQVEQLSKKVEMINQALESNTPRDSVAETNAVNHEDEEDFLELSPEDRLRIALIQTLLSSLTGREITFSITDLRIPKTTQQENSLPEPTPSSSASTTAPLTTAPLTTTPVVAAQGAGLAYQVTETFYQQESAQFQAYGQIKTADGKDIHIDFSLNMSRELLLQNGFSLRLGSALHDPLVINFDGKAAELTQQRFEFDLTLDGKKDLIPSLGQHSAFLALDRNGDGIINDGSELFGAKTGNGFAELAQYDDDQNGWIDENDFIFQHLRLWLKPGQGDSQQLIRLSDAGVGAIYLGNAETPFTLNNSRGDERLGVIRSTGIFVSEQGKAGLIQHVDLSI